MTDNDFPLDNLKEALTGLTLQRSLEIVSQVTRATLILFDCHGQVQIGPIAGNPFVQILLDSERGRCAMVHAHRRLLENPPENNCLVPDDLFDPQVFEHFAAPLVKNGQPAGTLTIGGRFKQPPSESQIQTLASACQVDRASLEDTARALPVWTAEESSAAWNLTALVAELIGTISASEEELRDRIEELTTVYNIVGLLAGTLNTQDILDKTAALVCQVMKAKACSIRMLDETTDQLTISAVHNLSPEYLEKGPVLLTENSIDSAAMQGTMVHVPDIPNDPRIRYPEQARREGLISGLICGLIYRGKAVGVLRVYTGEKHNFTPFEESLLRAVASQAAALVINARLINEQIEAERYAQQIAYAGEVQRRMIPSSPPPWPYAEIGTVYRPTFQVGGDYYDFISFEEGNLGVAIGDVSGKGVPASLLMVSLRSALRIHASHTYDLDHVLSDVNRHVCRDTTTAEFITVFYGVLNPDGKRLTYCNAGHDPPILLRDGRVHYLETGGMALGIIPDAMYERGILELQSGDIILLYTDGAVEALNFNDEQFGRKRLVESLQKHKDQEAMLIAKNILWDIRRFRGLADRIDDLTMVVLKIK